MIAYNSAFCCDVPRPLLEGQSILATVATHAARYSRAGFGGTTREGM
jgi:hypothetical protein